MTDHRTYRALTLLYPKEFRHDYRDDLIQLHADLTNHRGTTAAWTRSVLDLLVTVPRYRLEAIMNPSRSTTTLNLTITLLAFAGIASLWAGLYPGVALLGVAAVIAFSQRTSLARALRTPDTERRRRRLRTARALAVISIVTVGVFILDIGNDDHWGARAFLYNAIFYASTIAAMAYLVAGLLTPKNRPGVNFEAAT
jgi:hypothetical protein